MNSSWPISPVSDSISLFFFLKIFLMWTIFKVFIECVATLLLLYVLVF